MVSICRESEKVSGRIHEGGVWVGYNDIYALNINNTASREECNWVNFHEWKCKMQSFSDTIHAYRPTVLGKRGHSPTLFTTMCYRNEKCMSCKILMAKISHHWSELVSNLDPIS